jgi:PucR C-terminal helix-turn-helix domain
LLRDELQELVDRVSQLLAAPATLEDAEFTLLAFCAHDGRAGTGMDAVRTRSILTRGSPPETRRWFEEFGIARAERPLRTPADPDAGILTRLVIPVRHAGRTHGYLWLLDEGRTDPTDAADPALAAAIDLTAEAGRLLARREPAAGALDRVLRTALTGGPAARERAARVLSDGLGGTPAQVLVALAPGPDAGWRPPGAGAVSTVLEDDDGPVGAVLVPLRAPGDLRPAGALAAAALARLPAGAAAGMSAVRAGLGELAAQWAEARTAGRVAARIPELSPVASWAELGPWRAVSALPGPDPAVAPLLAEPVLARTAEVFLDSAGSAQRTAAELHVHRQTLYYRLGRVTALTGLDLADGGDRLLLHTALKAARLQGGR